MNGNWDPARKQAQIRHGIQSLRQLQDRKLSEAQITRRDIATLLKQNNVLLARAKAQNLVKEESICEVLDIVDSYCAFILDHYKELEKSEHSPSPLYIEACASIIYSLEHLRLKDLQMLCDLLKSTLGPEFYHSAKHNTENYVSHKVLFGVGFTPSIQAVDNCLGNIAKTYDVEWFSPMSAEEKLNTLSWLFDGSDGDRSADLQTIRRICGSGIPRHPPWLRPRLWRILLGVLPPEKEHWVSESSKKRAAYYDILRQTLPRTQSNAHYSSRGQNIEGLHNALASASRDLYVDIEREPYLISECPLSDLASAETKITNSSCLDGIVKQISYSTTGNNVTSSTPEIRLEGEPNTDSSSSTLHASSSIRSIPAHPGHASALLRLLFVHTCLHPDSNSPHVASLLITLYSVMNQEIEPSELTHVEADTFWVFEALCATLSEVEDENGGSLWMKKISTRLGSIDGILLERLQQLGLDPALPHYSFQWLDSMMTRTLPFSDVVVVWDAVMSQPALDRNFNPRLEHLVDISAAILVRARGRIMQAGQSRRSASVPSLWDGASDPPSPPMKPWQLGAAFEECLALLRRFPVKEAGGIERIIQIAADVKTWRTRDEKQTQGPWGESLRAKFRGSVLGGFINSPTTAEDSDEQEDETETEGEDNRARNSSGWTSRITTTVWRGITNQSAMDPPPSPHTSESAIPSPHTSSMPSPLEREKDNYEDAVSPPNIANSFWRYAAKLKESDVAASLSKTSTNWSVRAMGVMNRRGTETSRNIEVLATPSKHSTEETTPPLPGVSSWRGAVSPRELDCIDDYSPPPRPTHFRPPRDSRIDLAFSRPHSDSPPPAETSEEVELTPERSSTLSVLAPTTLLKRVASTSGLRLDSSSTSPRPPRSAPRPLVLNASSLVTQNADTHFTRSASNTPTSHHGQWTDSLRSRAQQRQNGSQSSISSSISLTSSGNNIRNTGWDSDVSVTSSRLVRLNRSSVSPMSPAFLARQRKQSCNSLREQNELRRRSPTEDALSQGTSTETGDESASFSRMRGWDMVNVPDSPSTLASPPPKTPTNFGLISVKVSDSENHRDSFGIPEPDHLGALVEHSIQNKKNSRKSTFPRHLDEHDETSDSSVAPISPRFAPRIRSKRYGTKPPNLRVAQSSSSPFEKGLTEQESQFGNLNALVAPDNDFDTTPTPRAADFPASSPIDLQPPVRLRKSSTEGRDQRPRKTSQDASSMKARKAMDAQHRRSESAADEGDDEGYDELLSAYESEEGFR